MACAAFSLYARAMPRYAAFLRGVSPMNLKMPALQAALEEDGFTEVKTLLSSGNAVFSGRRAGDTASEKGPVFMALIEKTFGKDVTTRTWDTVLKVVKAGSTASAG